MGKGGTVAEDCSGRGDRSAFSEGGSAEAVAREGDEGERERERPTADRGEGVTNASRSLRRRARR